MEMRVVGAGMGRTGTMSLKLALERLLGAPCYHMVEVFQHPEHVAAWRGAAEGQMPDWTQVLSGYAAAVDWPAAAFWPEISQAFPNAIILHSTRDSESWWKSASSTIFNSVNLLQPESEWLGMVRAMMASRFTTDLSDKDACIAAFERNNAHVLATAPKDRLLEWRASDGWAPICKALDLPIPDEPFPHANTTEEFLSRVESGRGPRPD